VNVTLLPAQILAFDAVMETAGVTGGVTDIVTILLFAVVVYRQDALLVNTQFTVFPVTNELFE
jgi:hypothetical protein